MSVDVIIPVHNGARFIARALASALSQDVALTVHCVDDASSDGSLKVIESLAATDDRIVVYRNDTNRGVAATRNLAITSSSAPFLAFLDQDDEWVPGKLALQLAALEDHPEIGWVIGYQRIALEPGASRPSWCRSEWLESPQRGYLPGTLLARREAFLAVGLLDETLTSGGDDTDWFARAKRASVEGLLLQDVVLQRWVHDRNGSASPGTNDDLLALVRRHVRENAGTSDA